MKRSTCAPTAMVVGGNTARVGAPTRGRAAGAQESSTAETTGITASGVLDRRAKKARAVMNGRRVGARSGSQDTDAHHPVTLHDAIHDVESGEHRAKHGVRTVEMRLTGVTEVILASTGIGP